MTDEKEIAKKLLDDLKEGRLKKIGIKEINAIILSELIWTGKIRKDEVDRVQERITRLVVELSCQPNSQN